MSHTWVFDGFVSRWFTLYSVVSYFQALACYFDLVNVFVRL